MVHGECPISIHPSNCIEFIRIVERAIRLHHVSEHDALREPTALHKALSPVTLENQKHREQGLQSISPTPFICFAELTITGVPENWFENTDAGYRKSLEDY
jgi:hypothetical protein